MDQYMKKELSLASVGHKKPFWTRKSICSLTVSVGIIILLLFLIFGQFETNKFLAHRLDSLSKTVKNQGTRLNQQRRNITKLSHQVKVFEKRLIEQNHRYLLQLKANLTLHVENIAKLEEKVTNSSLKVELHKQEVKKHLADIDQTIEDLRNKNISVFKHCYSSTDSCKKGSRGNKPYWRACRTTLLPKEKSVSYVYCMVIENSTVGLNSYVGLYLVHSRVQYSCCQ